MAVLGSTGGVADPGGLGELLARAQQPDTRLLLELLVPMQRQFVDLQAVVQRHADWAGGAEERLQHVVDRT
eukprot:841577-Lingulodinium_polyedra.AAC.1